MAVLNPQIPAGGGELAAPPGFMDFSGAVYGCHFDVKSGSSWTAEVGPDLTDTYGNASVQAGPTGRRHCYLRAGGLAAAPDGSLQIAGDVTVMLALRRLEASSSNQAYVAIANPGETSADNILYSILQFGTQIEARHEHGAGIDDAFLWNTAEAPDVRYFLSDWCVVWLRRSGLTQYLGVDSFQSQADTIASAPTDGSSTFLQVGNLVGTQLVQGMAFAGLGIWGSDIGYDDVQEQVFRIKKGASKV